MSEGSTVYDMIMNIRADEACHRDLNHHFADIPDHHKVDFHHVEVQDADNGKVQDTNSKPKSDDRSDKL